MRRAFFFLAFVCLISCQPLTLDLRGLSSDGGPGPTNDCERAGYKCTANALNPAGACPDGSDQRLFACPGNQVCCSDLDPTPLPTPMAPNDCESLPFVCYAG